MQDGSIEVMLWERKIHLEKEMQEALDPSVGQVLEFATLFRSAAES